MCRFWPVRQYPWGTCEAHSSEHSDVAALKKLLFEVSYEELKTATEERYYNFRERELLNPDKDDLNAGWVLLKVLLLFSQQEMLQSFYTSGVSFPAAWLVVAPVPSQLSR